MQIQSINSFREEYAGSWSVQNEFEFCKNTPDFCTEDSLIEVLNIFCIFSVCLFSFRRENLYSSTLGGGVATSPMLIVFHGKYSTINPMWHIRHLGKFNFTLFAAGTK